MTRAQPLLLFLRIGSALGLSLGLCACLDPRVSDEPGYSHRIRAASASVPPVADDVRLSGVIASNDGLPADVVPIREAFLGDAVVPYWDFGAASTTVGAAWVFRRRDDDGNVQDVGHLPLVDSAPGDDNYGPLRQLFVVYVNAAYGGERITSFEALEDATELGLVREPEATSEYVIWPITRDGAALQLASGDEHGTDEVYYRGYRVPCLRMDTVGVTLGELMLRRGRASANGSYALRRQWDDNPLDEVVLGQDLNEDGDMRDSNLIFSVGPGSGRYTGLTSTTEVIVAGSYEFGDVGSPEGLFPPPAEGEGPNPPADIVVSFSELGDTLLRPLVPTQDAQETAQ